ncbi:hypothetical protein F2Q69_00036044 [Brassica cretica]|uniref:Uncharacterized protein n=1 Tax=Brassica cretica TaxID=69181 RepID=A0A8S9SP47_BRACR|nr:hypothetical protein F2Q69_00036044 [Brassica cretica]
MRLWLHVVTRTHSHSPVVRGVETEILLEDAPARFTGGFFGSRSPSSLCGCRRSGFGELETPAVEGGEHNLRRKQRHGLRTVAVAWNLGFCLYPVYFGLLGWLKTLTVKLS